ncbi:hypothetical protein GII33_18075 [Gordonia pseudamarae]|uniref:Uncharacterized protein n=1 Tax=Gordonia pseudamarae TaxID=2831662 RepID=A0ABX6IKM9_9ACTN|nr:MULTISPECIES: hypothetical protein [Gordonia]MBD0021226.1 hypothetical protein [Gordonia sp. (in: high G+C Gram-positive bacteria)]QHN27590.1 hypothetical protein GII33_18075 [Gordonia pseudamarae]QHN36472.1 hypothetical protein GII31_17850 [Gordonia pseudamarae]
MNNQMAVARPPVDGSPAEPTGPRRMTSVAELIGSSRDDLIATFGPYQGNRLYLLCNGG